MVRPIAPNLAALRRVSSKTDRRVGHALELRLGVAELPGPRAPGREDELLLLVGRAAVPLVAQPIERRLELRQAPVAARVRLGRDGRAIERLEVLAEVAWPLERGDLQDVARGRGEVDSAAVSWWWGANIAPIAEMTTSNDASSNGRCSASASTHAIATPTACARRRPASSSSGVRSLAVTSAPACAAGIDAFPVPAATSRTRMPGPMPLAATSLGPSGSSHVSTIDG
jgi:hypothetical protein